MHCKKSKNRSSYSKVFILKLSVVIVINVKISIFLIDTEKNRIYMEKIKGITLKQFLWSRKGYNNSDNNIMIINAVADHSQDEQCKLIAQKLGVAIGKLHGK